MAFFSWFSSMFGGNATRIENGEQNNQPYSFAKRVGSMDEDLALQLSTVFRSIAITTNMVGSIPFSIYEDKGFGKERVRNDTWDLMQNRPNPTQTGQEFREAMTLNLMLHGNAYARIVRNQRGKPMAMWIMPAQNVSPILADSGQFYYKWHKIQAGTGEIVTLPEKDVLHIKLFGSGLTGLSPIAFGAQSLSIASAQEQFTGDYYTSGGKPGSIIESPTVLSKDQRKAWNDNVAPFLNGKQQNAHNSLLLEGGFKYTQTQLTPQDMATLEGRQYQVEDVARWFGVPIELLTKTASSNAQIGDIIRGWLMTDLGPLLTKWQQAYANALFLPAERKKYTVSADTHEVIRVDVKTLMDVVEKGVRNGVMTQNEGRDWLHLPRMDGEQYNELRQQQQMVAAGTTGDKDVEQTSDTA